jgi:hypothetical protein
LFFLDLQVGGQKGLRRESRKSFVVNAGFSLFGWSASIPSDHSFRRLTALDIGTELDITLQAGDSTLLAAGEVVTCDRTVGNGIRFTSMLPEDREELGRFLQVVEAKPHGDVPPEEAG